MIGREDETKHPEALELACGEGGITTGTVLEFLIVASCAAVKLFGSGSGLPIAQSSSYTPCM